MRLAALAVVSLGSGWWVRRRHSGVSRHHSAKGSKMAEFFSSFWVQLVLKLIVAATIIPVVGMVIGFAEMKLSAKMQSRVGPYFAGGRWGWAQLIADGVKFFQKEDLIPAEADRPVYKWAPALVLVSAVAILVPIPLGPSVVARNLDLGVFYVLAVSSISTIGVLMAGWSSANKYSLMGGLRAAGQLIAYELAPDPGGGRGGDHGRDHVPHRDRRGPGELVFGAGLEIRDAFHPGPVRRVWRFSSSPPWPNSPGFPSTCPSPSRSS